MPIASPSSFSLLRHCEDSAIAPIFLTGKTEAHTPLATSGSKLLASFFSKILVPSLSYLWMDGKCHFKGPGGEMAQPLSTCWASMRTGVWIPRTACKCGVGVASL